MNPPACNPYHFWSSPRVHNRSDFYGRLIFLFNPITTSHRCLHDQIISVQQAFLRKALPVLKCRPIIACRQYPQDKVLFYWISQAILLQHLKSPPATAADPCLSFDAEANQPIHVNSYFIFCSFSLFSSGRRPGLKPS